MKNLFIYLLFIFVLGLNSCSQAKDSSNSETQQNDYLVYRKSWKLLSYNPTSNTHGQILPEWNVNEFSISANNRLAFSSSQNGKSSIYVLDYPFTEKIPVEIAPDISSTDTSPLWSLDGHYLLFDSIQPDNTKALVIWDGENFSSIYNHQGKISEATWSVNRQLAFTEFFINTRLPDVDTGEVYVWDGHTTVSVSQNPSGEDRSPAWSKDSQLAFLSNRSGENDIFVWDGESKNNGIPDVNSFVNIAPDLTQYFSDPTWTSSGTLAFTGIRKSDTSNFQIYEWDGQNARNISQNPTLHNGGQTWRNDGYWSFNTFLSGSQNLYIRDTANRTILETEGQSPAWSQNGLLIFCVPNYHGYTLSMWNGKDVIEIDNGSFFEAKWNNGNRELVFCAP